MNNALCMFITICMEKNNLLNAINNALFKTPWEIIVRVMVDVIKCVSRWCFHYELQFKQKWKNCQNRIKKLSIKSLNWTLHFLTVARIDEKSPTFTPVQDNYENKKRLQPILLYRFRC